MAGNDFLNTDKLSSKQEPVLKPEEDWRKSKPERIVVQEPVNAIGSDLRELNRIRQLDNELSANVAEAPVEEPENVDIAEVPEADIQKPEPDLQEITPVETPGEAPMPQAQPVEMPEEAPAPQAQPVEAPGEAPIPQAQPVEMPEEAPAPQAQPVEAPGEAPIPQAQPVEAPSISAPDNTGAVDIAIDTPPPPPIELDKEITAPEVEIPPLSVEQEVELGIPPAPIQAPDQGLNDKAQLPKTTDEVVPPPTKTQTLGQGPEQGPGAGKPEKEEDRDDRIATQLADIVTLLDRYLPRMEQSMVGYTEYLSSINDKLDEFSIMVEEPPDELEL